MNLNFKQEVEEFVSKARLQMKHSAQEGESTICLRCKNFVRFYFPIVLHHPEVCEGCIKILYTKWERKLTSRPFLEQDL